MWDKINTNGLPIIVTQIIHFNWAHNSDKLSTPCKCVQFLAKVSTICLAIICGNIQWVNVEFEIHLDNGGEEAMHKDAIYSCKRRPKKK